MIKDLLPSIILSLLLAIFSVSLCADDFPDDVPEEVQDLRYGVVLYHFFQQSYFDALTEVMVGETRSDMPYHQQSAELLRGGMSLSYGMSDQAEAIFSELLTTLDHQVDRDRAWFYLGKLYYLRGERDKAKAVFARIVAELSPPLQEEKLFLTANIQLANGDSSGAGETVSRLPKTSPWLAYYYFNLGSRKTLSGHWRDGVSNFQKIDELSLTSEEGAALRDKAYTASGFAYLGGAEYEQAIDDFLKVRLESPLVEKALLGYGWAAAQQGDFERALAPWQTLSQRSLMSASVQESLLAIPYAYEKLGAQAGALLEYQGAVAAFDKELKNLATAIDVFRDLPLVDVIAEDIGLGADWIMGHDYLPINQQAPYLSHLISQDYFQSAVKDLSDLTKMRQYLAESAIRIGAMETVLETQNRVWTENLSQSQREQYRQKYDELMAIRNEMQALKTADEENTTKQVFLSPEEVELWDVITHAEDAVEQLLNANYDVSEEVDQLHLYRGLLMWQAAEQDSDRRWEFDKELVEIDESLALTRQHLQQLEGFSEHRYDEQFAGEIVGLKSRVLTQQQAVDIAVAELETEIRELAIVELENQQQRLSYYLAQAKLAIARLYDLGSEGAGQ